jgi:hypothetical protein
VGTLRSRGLLAAVTAACVALPAAATGAPTGATTPAFVAAGSQTFPDSTGEDPQGPDITNVVVSNTDAGVISFRINVANRPQLAQDMWLDLPVDTDNNRSTGDPIGADYFIQLIRGEVQLFRWDGTGFTRTFGNPSAVTLNFSYQNGYTIRIAAAELGNTRRFSFYVELLSGVVFDPVTGAPDCTACHADAVPGGVEPTDYLTYTVNIARPSLVVRSLRGTPAAPKAGQQFTLRMVAARSDSGAVLQNGRVTCVGRAGTARLRAQVQRVQGRAVVCTWLIPANAKGRTFRGSVTVAFEGLRASRGFTARIR